MLICNESSHKNKRPCVANTVLCETFHTWINECNRGCCDLVLLKTVLVHICLIWYSYYVLFHKCFIIITHLIWWFTHIMSANSLITVCCCFYPVLYQFTGILLHIVFTCKRHYTLTAIKFTNMAFSQFIIRYIQCAIIVLIIYNLSWNLRDSVPLDYSV